MKTVSFENYSQRFKTNAKYLNQEKKLLELLDTLKFSSVLEIGCSFGRITALIHKHYFPTRFLTIDEADDKRYTGGNVEFIKTDIMSLPEEEKFDLVIAIEVLMHNENFQAIINKMKSLSSRYIVHVDYWDDKIWDELGRNTTWYLGNGNYLHDYTGIRTQISQDQAMFYYVRKD